MVAVYMAGSGPCCISRQAVSACTALSQPWATSTPQFFVIFVGCYPARVWVAEVRERTGLWRMLSMILRDSGEDAAVACALRCAN